MYRELTVDEYLHYCARLNRIPRSHVNAGIYAMEPASLDYLGPATHCDMPALFEMLREQGQQIMAYPMHEPWLDIGGKEEFRQAQSMGKDSEDG